MSGASPAEIVRFAAGAIVAHPLRSGLTSLGVVIGVAAVVMMTSIGLGAQKRVTDTISGLGSNLIIVTPLQPRTAGGVMGGAGAGQSLTDADAEAIRRQVEGAAAVAPSVTGMAQVTADGANWNTSIVGVTPEYLEARDLTIASGRMFEDRDARQGRKVAVLGPTVVAQLWGEADPWEPVAEAHDWARTYTCVRELVVLPGLGHCPFDEDPATVVPILRRWLADPPAPD